MLNRTLTFDSSNRWEGESFRYLVTQSIGPAISLVVFSGIVMVFWAGTPLVPLAAGARSGTGIQLPDIEVCRLQRATEDVKNYGSEGP